MFVNSVGKDRAGSHSVEAEPVKPRQAAKAAAWFTVASLLTNALGFITIPIFTRLMTTEEFGAFSAIAALQIMLVTLFGLEGHLVLNRARFDLDKDEAHTYQFSVLTLSLLLVAVLSTFVLAFPAYFEGLIQIDRKYFPVMLLYLMFLPAFSMFQAFQRVQYRYKISVALSFLVAMLSTVLSIFLVSSLADSLMGRVVGYYLTFAVFGLGLWLFYWKRGRRIRIRYWAYALKLGLPLVLATLASQAILLGNRLVVQHVAGAESLAYLAIALSVANIAVIVTTVLDRAWSPWLMDCLNTDNRERIFQVFVPYLGFVTVITAGVSFLAPEITLILGGPVYLPGVVAIPSIMAGTLLGMIAKQYVFVQTFYKTVHFGSFMIFIMAAVNILLSFFAVGQWGFEAVGYVNIVTYAILIILHKTVLKVLKLEDPFPIYIIGLAIVIALVLLPIELYLIQSELLAPRLIAVGILGIISILSIRRIREITLKRMNVEVG